MSADFWQWYDRAYESADRHGVPCAELDWLVQVVLGIDKLHLRLRDVQIESMGSIADLWQQRIKERVPVQYLAGRVQWRGMELVVSPAVLIPRPETELLIDIVDGLPPSVHRLGAWADMGTGSGAIAIGLKKIMPCAEVHGVDISPEALQVARLNAQNQGVKVEFYEGSWFSAVPFLKGQLIGVVANPPYIPSKDIKNLDQEVCAHEPLLALDGGKDGLEAIVALLVDAPAFIRQGGHLILELMAGQAPIIKGVLQKHPNFTNIKIHRDLNLHDRFISAIIC